MSLSRMFCLAAAAAAAGLTAATAAAAPPVDRYDLVHGCYSIEDRDAGAPIGAASGPFRMQATGLGRYLLYGTHRDFLADPGDGRPAAAATPSPAAEWIVRGSSATGFSMTNRGTGKILRVAFTEQTGCAVYPEISPGATGRPRPTGNPNGRASGWVDGHMHWTGYGLFGGDWHCGRPWHPYGAPYALPDCAQYDVGTNRVIRDAEDGRTPGQPYDSAGWPTFGDWPAANRLSDEASYYTSVERAWLSGLRVLVVLFVDNESMCDIMTVRHLPCHDMNSVRVQNRGLEELQDYVDAQEGGPGKGWLRIVTSPEQARRVINQGKLAVVKGIELSRVLDCGEFDGKPECDRAQVDDGLRELWGMGIRDFYPVHKFDNGFGGTKGDSGQTGYIVNSGNFKKTGHFWDMRRCPAAYGDNHDQTQIEAPTGGDDAYDLVDSALGDMSPAAKRLPVYGPGPHCNTRGLTPIGRYLINRMIDERFLIEIDHMSEKTADAALDIVERRRYSGVVTTHGWSSPRSVQRILDAGGISTIGSDINGLAGQPGRPSPDGEISYPFTSYDGQVTFDRQKWGERTFDYNKEGVAQYGLRADWIASRLKREGQAGYEDIFVKRGAEAYLQMWERAMAHGDD